MDKDFFICEFDSLDRFHNLKIVSQEDQRIDLAYEQCSYASESNLDRLGPAITPTSPKRTTDRTPTIVAERLPPPKAKVKNGK